MKFELPKIKFDFKKEVIVEKKGLRPIQDSTLLEKMVEEVLSENPQVLEKIKAGESKPIDFLIGQMMKKSKGKANPKEVRDLILNKLP